MIIGLSSFNLGAQSGINELRHRVSVKAARNRHSNTWHNSKCVYEYIDERSRKSSIDEISMNRLLLRYTNGLIVLDIKWEGPIVNSR
jgi:hypothetical protein